MPTTTAIEQMGAAAIADAIASGSLSPLEVAAAFMERIKTYDHAIEAFSSFDRETAWLEATALTDEAKAGDLRGPLHGVPFAVKEQFAVNGLAIRGDYKDPESPVAAYDATIVARLKAAGALMLGKTYMTGPSGTPPTKNPWNLEYTPGGSSSGSGAAVGARMAPFSLSEQTAGSGLRPAAYCGVSALKPTYGRNSRYGMFQMAYSHDHACIIATSMPDIARIFAVTAGFDPLDPSSVAGNEPGAVVALDRPPRIGIVRNFFPDLTEPVMQAAIETAAANLALAGADVTDFHLPDAFGMAWSNWSIVGGIEANVINVDTDRRRAERGLPPPVKMGGSSASPASKFGVISRDVTALLPATYYLQAQRIRRWLRSMTDEAISPFDAILMATAPGPAPRDLSSSGDWSLLTPWSHLGQPAVTIPGGLSPEGLPLGLQLVSPTMTDEKLLAVGAWCEDVLGLLPAPTL
jgi:Asp-tRNA(Asn)/Glu-tRNA(Gln) amidotransferase A subunit family amidase